MARRSIDLVLMIRACLSSSSSITPLFDVPRCLQTISISALWDNNDVDWLLLSFSETDSSVNLSVFNCSLSRRSLTAITAEFGSFSSRSCCASSLLLIILREFGVRCGCVCNCFCNFFCVFNLSGIREERAEAFSSERLCLYHAILLSKSNFVNK